MGCGWEVCGGVGGRCVGVWVGGVWGCGWEVCGGVGGRCVGVWVGGRCVIVGRYEAAVCPADLIRCFQCAQVWATCC